MRSCTICSPWRSAWLCAGQRGGLPALGWLAAALLAPGIQTGMKNLYWCLWLWLLPVLAGVLFCAVTLRRGHAPAWACLLPGAACLIRCMCGFEFVSAHLILTEAPLVFCWAAALTRRQPGRPWFLRMAAVGCSAVGGVLAALLVWLCQGFVCFGSWRDSLANILGAAGSRLSVSDDAVRQGVTIPGVLYKYFVADSTPVLRLGGWEMPLGLLLAVTAAALAAGGVVLALRRRQELVHLVPVFCLWLLGILAPASWLVLSKAHSDIHGHLIPVLFQYAAVPASLALWGALLAALVRTLRPAH